MPAQKVYPERSRRGFTLVELLVTISIIAILSAVGLVVFTGAQKSGRTAKRIQDLKAIQTAVELYYSVNTTYPSTSNDWKSECSGWGGYSANDVIQGLAPTYIMVFPADPSMNKTTPPWSCYLYRSNGVDYKLIDIIAEFSSADYQTQRSLIDPAKDGGPDGCLVDGTNIGAWSVWSSPVSACW